MHHFVSAVEDIGRDFRRLIEMEPFRLDTRPSPVPKELAGVYVLYESRRALYVGRGRDIRKRLADHRSSSVTAASLAVKMARIAAKTPTTYKSPSKAVNLLKTNQTFEAAFKRATACIRGMHVRYVDTDYEDNDVRQALLEIYAASELGPRWTPKTGQ